MTSRNKMCSNKVSFRNKARAESCAAKFGQRIYECPICFCWHTTSKQSYEEEFITIEHHKKIINKMKAELEVKYKNKYKQSIKELLDIIKKLKGKRVEVL